MKLVKSGKCGNCQTFGKCDIAEKIAEQLKSIEVRCDGKLRFTDVRLSCLFQKPVVPPRCGICHDFGVICVKNDNIICENDSCMGCDFARPCNCVEY